MTTTPNPTPEMPTVQFTQENVTDLLDCAGYGISYWAESATVDGDARTYRVLCDESVELNGGTEIREKTLTFDQIQDAFNTLAKLGMFPDWQMAEIKEGELAFDAMVADITVQQAMFDEIIFG